MAILLSIPAFVCGLLMAAHFLRSGVMPVVAMCLLAPLITVIPRPCALRVMQLLLIVFAAEWVRSLVIIAAARLERGEPWMRMAIILLTVAAFNLLAAFALQLRLRRCRSVAVIEPTPQT